MAELAVGAAAAGATLQQIWGYNQDCYNFDKTMQQSAMHQRQQMRREWIFLFRDDINQMVDLTILRMDNYILTNTLQITLIMAILGEGSLLPSGDMPAFSTWAFMLSFTGGIVMLVLSTWMAMHASITAHSCGLSLLLQSRQVRDLPTGTEIDAFRARLQDFEETDVRKQLRIPFATRLKQFFGNVMGPAAGPEVESKENKAPQTAADGSRLVDKTTSALKTALTKPEIPFHYEPDALEHFYINERLEEAERKDYYLNRGGGVGGPVNTGGAAVPGMNMNYGTAGSSLMPGGMAGSTSRNNPRATNQAELTEKMRPRLQIRTSHLDIFRILQKHWQHFDAYARVTNALGTYMMLNAIAFFLLTYLAIFQKMWLLAWMCGALYAFLSRAIATVDLVLNRWESYLLTVLQTGVVFVILMIYTCALLADRNSIWNTILIPLSALFQFSWLTFLFYLSQPTNAIESPHGHLPEKFRQILYIDCLAWKRLDDTILRRRGAAGGNYGSSSTGASSSEADGRSNARLSIGSSSSSSAATTAKNLSPQERLREERKLRIQQAVTLRANKKLFEDQEAALLFQQNFRGDEMLNLQPSSYGGVVVKDRTVNVDLKMNLKDEQTGKALPVNEKENEDMRRGAGGHGATRPSSPSTSKQVDRRQILIHTQADLFAGDFLEVMDHACELEAYLDTWMAKQAEIRRKVGGLAEQAAGPDRKDDASIEGTTTSTLRNRRNHGGKEINEQMSTVEQQANYRSTNATNLRNSTSMESEQNYFVYPEQRFLPSAEETDALLTSSSSSMPPPPVNIMRKSRNKFHDEALSLLSNAQNTVASFGTASRRNSVMSSNSAALERQTSLQPIPIDFASFKDKMDNTFRPKILELLQKANLNPETTFQQVRQKKQHVAKWVQIPDYDNNTGLYMPCYVYYDRKVVKYSVPDTVFMRSNFLEHGFEVLEENLRKLEDNLDELLAVGDSATTDVAGTVGTGMMNKKVVQFDSPNGKKNNSKEEPSSSSSALPDESSASISRPSNKNRGPKKRNLIDRLGAWLSEKKALYETPHVIQEIETLEATATEANYLPQVLFNRVMISLLISWLVALVTLSMQEYDAYYKFLRVPGFKVHLQAPTSSSGSIVQESRAAAARNEASTVNSFVQIGQQQVQHQDRRERTEILTTQQYLQQAGTVVTNFKQAGGAGWNYDSSNAFKTGEIARIACNEKCGVDKIVYATEFDLLNFNEASQPGNECAREMQDLIVSEIENQMNRGSSSSSADTSSSSPGSTDDDSEEDLQPWLANGYKEEENFRDIIDIAMDNNCNPVVLLQSSIVRCKAKEPAQPPEINGQLQDSSLLQRQQQQQPVTQHVRTAVNRPGGGPSTPPPSPMNTGGILNSQGLIPPEDHLQGSGTATSSTFLSSQEQQHQQQAQNAAVQDPSPTSELQPGFEAEIVKIVGQWEGQALQPRSLYVNPDTNDVILGVDHKSKPTLLLMVTVSTKKKRNRRWNGNSAAVDHHSDPSQSGEINGQIIERKFLRPTAEVFYNLAEKFQSYDQYWQDPNRVQIHQDHDARIPMVPHVFFLRKNPKFKGPETCSENAPAWLCYYEKSVAAPSAAQQNDPVTSPPLVRPELDDSDQEPQFRYMVHVVTQLQYGLTYKGGKSDVSITPNVNLVNACFLNEKELFGISSNRALVSYEFASIFQAE
ncbi:unnamed protein product [Amoebophrya sp. A120]|nr:unnamed protein product [Amoebophrya sp. A120]|eukprot:GSA120T00008637001.1